MTSAVPMVISPALSPRSSDLRTLGPWLTAEFLNSYAVLLFLPACFDWAERHLVSPPSHRLWLSVFWGASYIFISLLAGRLVEKLGPRKSAVTLSTLSVLTALAGLLMLAVPSIWMVALVMLPYNLTSSAFWPAIECGLTRSPGKMRLSTRMAAYNLSWGGAAFVGMATHGILAHWSFVAVFVAAALASGLAAVILARWAPRALTAAAAPAPDDDSGAYELVTPEMKRRAAVLLKLAWISNPLAYVAIYVLMPVMPDLTRQAGIADLSLASLVGSVWFVTRFIGFAVTWKWTRWHYRVAWQIGPMVALTLSLVGMLLWHNLLALIVLQAVFGFSAALVYSASLYYSMHVSEGHGGHAAFHEAVIGIGTAAGPLVGAVCAAGQTDHTALARVALGMITVLGGGIMVTAVIAARAKLKALPRRLRPGRAASSPMSNEPPPGRSAA